MCDRGPYPTVPRLIPGTVNQGLPWRPAAVGEYSYLCLSSCMGKSKSTDRPTDRAVYREFGPADPLARAVPELPPSQQTLRLHVSRKGRGGKTVTVVSGFRHRPETLATLARQLKAQCGTGGTAKEDSIEIQGDHRETLRSQLVARGYQVTGG